MLNYVPNHYFTQRKEYDNNTVPDTVNPPPGRNPGRLHDPCTCCQDIPGGEEDKLG